MAKQKKDAIVFFRVTTRDKKRLDSAARRKGFKNSSEWARYVLLLAAQEAA
jgi:hypothetical protein